MTFINNHQPIAKALQRLQVLQAAHGLDTGHYDGCAVFVATSSHLSDHHSGVHHPKLVCCLLQQLLTVSNNECVHTETPRNLGEDNRFAATCRQHQKRLSASRMPMIGGK